MTFFSLNPRFVYGSLDLTSAPFAVNQEGIDYQSGDLVVSILSSFLQDGELEMSERRGNMTLIVPVLIESSVGLLPLAQAEAQLAAEAQRDTNTLTITPGDGAPATVFETFESSVDYTYNANAEQNGFRQFNVTMRALPFGKSAFNVTAAAVVIPPGAAPTPVSVNNGSSTSGWGSFNSSPVTVTSDGNVIRANSAPNSAGVQLTQSFEVTTTRWVVVDWKPGADPSGNAYTYGPNLGINYPESGDLPFAYRADRLANGFTRSYWRVPDSVTATVTKLVFIMQGSTDLYIDQVSRTSAPPALGTNRQQSRTVAVAGSARTQAAVNIYSPTSSLGEVLVHTSTGGASLPLSGYRTSGSVTTDSTRVSGAYANLATPSVHDIPVSSLPPGLYSLVALVAAPSGARTLTCSTVTRLGSLTVGRAASGTAVAWSATYRFVALGNINLPTNGSRPNTSAMQRVTVADSSTSGATALLDELYLLNLTTGRVSIVSCGDGAPASGGPSSRLWLDAATVASRTPTVMRGTSADGSDAFYANDSIQLLGLHEFVPPTANIFTVTTNATDAAVTLTHAPRWLGHAALVAP